MSVKSGPKFKDKENKYLPGLNECCNCPFNEHGQEYRIHLMETYLGVPIRIYGTTTFGGPMLYCMYNPKASLRDNVRGLHSHTNFIIWIAGRDQFEGEFERQLEGFPKRCPLDNSKTAENKSRWNL